MQRYYINVMRLCNWQVDLKNNAEFLAIGKSKFKFASNLRAGDKIITYVSSRKSCFVAIRTVISNDLKTSKIDLGYDEPYFNFIVTEPDFILPENSWVSIKPLLNELEFTKGKKSWMNMLMGAFKEISAQDYFYLEKYIADIR